MRERVELLVGRATRAMWVMTFHSACARMLRADAHRLGYTRQFTIYDAADSRRLIKKCIDELDIDPKRFTPRAMQAQISDAKNKLRTRGGLPPARRLVLRADRRRRLRGLRARAAPRQRDGLRRPAVPRGQRARAVPGGPRPLRRARSAGCSSTSTRTPTRPSTAGSSCSRASTATSPWSATTTSRSTASAAPTSRTSSTSRTTIPTRRSIKLEQNYRSTQTILSAANALIANNRGQKPKELWTDVGEGDEIKVRELSDEHAEARYVAAEIERLVDEGVTRAELAVFYRTNAQSRVLEDMLVRAQIGYQVIGGTKFYERAEIKDAVAYLTFLVNPADGGAFTRIANAPKRGIGQTSLSRVLAHAETMGITPWEAAAAAEDVPTLGTAARRAFARFMSTIERLQGAGRQRRAGRRGAGGDAARDRLPRRARGRADDRGPGPDREPRRARPGRARVRRRSRARGRPPASPSSSSRSR